MTHLFLVEDLAKWAVKLGFDDPCFGHWDSGELYFHYQHECFYGKSKMDQTDFNGFGGDKAPLWTQVIDWLRESHNIVLIPQYVGNVSKRNYFICDMITDKCKKDLSDMKRRLYYNAIQDGVKAAFKLLDDERTIGN